MNIIKTALWALGILFALQPALAQQSVPLAISDTSKKQLEEVLINGSGTTIEQQPGKTILHLETLPSLAGATAYDVLERSPGVVIANSSISMKGKNNVLVMIDHKPAYVSGEALENLLKSMPADRLSRIELMTNPPAKYDAAGNAGIINIITRKQKNTGLNGGLNLVLRQSRRTSNYNTGFFNYRNNKFNFMAEVSGGYRQRFEDLDIQRRYRYTDGSPQAFFDQSARSTTKGGIGRAKLGMDFYQDEHTTWGVGFTGNLWASERNETIDGRQRGQDGAEAFALNGRNKDETGHRDGWLNLNYRRTFDQAARELTIDADYLNYDQHSDQTFANALQGPGTADTQDLLAGRLHSDIRIYTIKSDYTQMLFRSWKMDAGLKAAFTETDNKAAYDYTAGGITRPDYDKSNHFSYKENINAAYLNLMYEGRKLSVQAGLRLENTLADGHQLGNVLKPDSAFRRNYTQLFPTFYVLYKIDTNGNHMIGVNYGKRIDRPYFQDLNPFVTPIDRFTYYSGNPFLRPSFTHNLELAYAYRDIVSVTFSYSNSRDNVNETVSIVNGIFYSRPGNIGSRVVAGMNIDARKALFPWLTAHLYVEWMHIQAKTDLNGGMLNTRGSYVLLSPDVQIRAGKGWSADLSGRYMSSVYNVQLKTGAYWTVTAGIQKRVSDAASFKLSLRDIFFTQINKGTVHNLVNADASWENRSDTRMAVLSFSYRFGKAIQGQRKHDATGAQGEQNRIKN